MSATTNASSTALARDRLGVAAVVFFVISAAAPLTVVVLGYFARHPSGESAWHRIGAPALATVLLVGVTYLAVTNIATLFGVDPGSAPTWAVPLAFGVVAVAGVVWALVLRPTRPAVYAGIGRGSGE
jgi:hypothetical protein